MSIKEWLKNWHNWVQIIELAIIIYLIPLTWQQNLNYRSEIKTCWSVYPNYTSWDSSYNISQTVFNNVFNNSTSK